MALKYKIGDRVRIKSIDWYNENKDEGGYINCGSRAFFTKMSDWCGKIVTIKEICKTNCYHLEEYDFDWTDEMIEGLMESIDCKKCGLTRMSTRCLFMDNCPHNKQKTIIEIPEDWVLKDENGDEILTSKIILEKKKKEVTYPKTYEECVVLLGLGVLNELKHCDLVIYKKDLIVSYQKLLICRDAYWKIYGEEMGLDGPWEPDWNDTSIKYCLERDFDAIDKNVSNHKGRTFAFPTVEMRDAFYDNFKKEIEICKELL